MSISQPAGDFCELHQTEEKGLGVFAKVDIAEGTVISEELSIAFDTGDFKFSAATWENPTFWENFKAHGLEDVERGISYQIGEYYKDEPFEQAAFARLSRSMPGDLDLSENANVFFSSCLSSDKTESPFQILFGPTTCAFNHSCVANAYLQILPEEPAFAGGRRTIVMAIQPIKAGTEITISYLISNSPKLERRRQLRDTFRFDCVCDTCKDESGGIEDVYADLNRLLQQVEVPPEHDIKKHTPWLFFKTAVELGSAYQLLRINDSRLPTLWKNCASVAAYHSDALRTSHLLNFALHYPRMLPDDEVLRLAQLLLNPAAHPQWGHTQMGLSSLADNEFFMAHNDGDVVKQRILMVNHHEDSYDRILPKEEAERLADEAARELLAEEEEEKGRGRGREEAGVAGPAKKKKKNKKKKKGKGKKGGDGEGEGEEGEEAVVAGPSVTEERLNVAQEGEEDVGGWQEVGKGGKWKGKEVVEEAGEEVEVGEVEVGEVEVGEAKGVEDVEVGQGKGEVEEVRSAQRVEAPGFSVAEAALAGEAGTLARLRGNSQPPPFSSPAMFDEGLALPRGGREYSRRCAEYVDFGERRL